MALISNKVEHLLDDYVYKQDITVKFTVLVVDAACEQRQESLIYNTHPLSILRLDANILQRNIIINLNFKVNQDNHTSICRLLKSFSVIRRMPAADSNSVFATATKASLACDSTVGAAQNIDNIVA